MSNKILTKFNCLSCGPQKLIGDFGSKTHVLCLNCGEELSIKDQYHNQQQSNYEP